ASSFFASLLDPGDTETVSDDSGSPIHCVDPDASDGRLPTVARRFIRSEQLDYSDHRSGSCKPCLFVRAKVGCARHCLQLLPNDPPEEQEDEGAVVPVKGASESRWCATYACHLMAACCCCRCCCCCCCSCSCSCCGCCCGCCCSCNACT
ncbi:unnamed protein product, partial [Polarella glacialis]